MKKLNIFFFIIGAGILSALIYWAGPEQILENISRAGWGIVLLILLNGLAQMLFAGAWRVILGKKARGISFTKIFCVYMAGDAVNYVIPSGNLAGEPVKAHILRERIPFSDGLASVTINKLSETISMTIFLLIGLATGLWTLSLPPSLKIGSTIIFLGTVGSVILFFRIQKRGIFSPLQKLLIRIGIKKPLKEEILSARNLDANIADFYGHRVKDFWASVSLNLTAWFFGAAEVYGVLFLLDLNATWQGALLIESFSILANNASFFLPGRIGGSESGKALIFTGLGFSLADGVSFALIRRIREIFWAGFGFSVLGITGTPLKWKKKDIQTNNTGDKHQKLSGQKHLKPNGYSQTESSHKKLEEEALR